ncbi:hypothetical protein HMPREF1986_00089 [Oribacterium sp. oral taxon 078 str. F0263]|nr:hypothetical protein GCWU000341_00926 [Oribacterium sp. oral taxon 078 str. F0262]ERL23004.1 hypothetical protein HMPREF1986_00089 [Oribacterium sp. oral taxon 078 str. F0263]
MYPFPIRALLHSPLSPSRPKRVSREALSPRGAASPLTQPDCGSLKKQKQLTK